MFCVFDQKIFYKFGWFTFFGTYDKGQICARWPGNKKFIPVLFIDLYIFSHDLSFSFFF